MLWTKIKHRLRDFRDDTRGSIMVETVMTLPILFFGLAATYEFFEIHRYQSARIKATYTIADMLSRENNAVNQIYLDNAKILFDQIANDSGDNQVRISVIRYDGPNDQYQVEWSEVRGTASDLLPLTDSIVANKHDELPILSDREEVILVEATSPYDNLFEVGLDPNLMIDTSVFTSIRFAPQIECVDCIER